MKVAGLSRKVGLAGSRRERAFFRPSLFFRTIVRPKVAFLNLIKPAKGFFVFVDGLSGFFVFLGRWQGLFLVRLEQAFRRFLYGAACHRFGGAYKAAAPWFLWLGNDEHRLAFGQTIGS